jgi:glycosyltransferase involved in cell wall biosynthesis
MSESTAKISLCICTYNRYDELPKAIDSAASQTLPAEDYEIIVVDNSPDHDQAEAFGNSAGDAPNLTYVVEETAGLANARNVAARITQAPIIAYLDDDAVASPQWAEEILKAFEMFGPRTSIVGGRVEPIWGAPRPSWLHESMIGYLSVVDWGGDDARLALPSEWFAGANIAFRVEALKRYGGFSTQGFGRYPAEQRRSRTRRQNTRRGGVPRLCAEGERPSPRGGEAARTFVVPQALRVAGGFRLHDGPGGPRRRGQEGMGPRGQILQRRAAAGAHAARALL